MRSVRLLPIVIFAAVALLLFKAVGLVTNGGYILTGTTVVAAAGAHPDAEGDPSPAPTIATEPTMMDSSPTLDDHAPTLAASAAAPDPTGPAGAKDGKPVAPEAGKPAEPATPPAATTTTAAAADPAAGVPHVPSLDCPEPGKAASTQQIGAAIADATSGAPLSAADCPTPDAHAEAAPTVKDSKGNAVPLANPDATPETESAILERLAERRAELDARESDLSMREALVEAAEKRITERTAALEGLEKQINGLLDQKKAQEDEQFKSLITMYEGMKPADVAAIFNDLDLNVLLRLARGMNPRKMAPIMSKMTPARAQELTVHMADEQADPPATAPGADLAALPQIVGQ